MMPAAPQPRGPVSVTEVEEFLRAPPPGFSVTSSGAVHRIHGDPERNLVLIDDFDWRGATLVFQKSLGRRMKARNLREYSGARASLLSKTLWLLASARRRAASPATVGETAPGAPPPDEERYIVSVDGSDPLVRWQMERGLDRTIASVAGESYTVDIDVTEALEGCTAAGRAWTDASFTLKYRADALFDFPHWLGFSKRRFGIKLLRPCLK